MLSDKSGCNTGYRREVKETKQFILWDSLFATSHLFPCLHSSGTLTLTCFFHLIFTQAEAISSAIFTGEEEIFAFERTISRLTEMQTEQYWNWQGFRKSWDVFGS